MISATHYLKIIYVDLVILQLKSLHPHTTHCVNCAQKVQNVLNLSTIFSPSAAQIKLLERGLTFIPNPNTHNNSELHRDIHLYHRRLKNIDYFPRNNYNHTPFTFPSTWEPSWSNLSKPMKQLLKKDIVTFNDYIADPDRVDNLSKTERVALQQLKNNKNIIIKPADKGSKVVIMDSQQYAFEAHRQLSNNQFYKSISSSIHTESRTKIIDIISSLYHNKFITAKQRNFLYGPDEPRARLFYLLPKIHKDADTWTIPNIIPPGRPIVSDCDSTTYNVARYIDHYLNPLSSLHPSYIKDTYHFLDVIRPITVPSASLLFTIDIDSLYTNINTNMGLRAVREVLNRHPDPSRPDSELLQLLEICLTYNDFIFNDQWFLQIQGTAMGHRYAPSYANIYMSEWEREALAKCPLKPSFYYRFLDDIIGVWPHGTHEFMQFVKILNDHHPSINIKHTLDPHSVNFLDTTIHSQRSQQPRKNSFLVSISNPQTLMHCYTKQAIIRDIHLRELSNHKFSAFTVFAAGPLTSMTLFRYCFKASDPDIVRPDFCVTLNERLWLPSPPFLLHPSSLPPAHNRSR